MKIINKEGLEIKYINADIKVDNHTINIKSKKNIESKIIFNLKNNFEINISCEEKSKNDIQIIFSGEIILNLNAKKEANVKLVHFALGNSKIIPHLNLYEESKLIHAHGSICKKNEFSFADIKNTLSKKATTDIISRNILHDTSSSDIRCMIKIDKKGENSSGLQDLKTMMFDKKTVSKIMPLLEIENSKVKCTHAAGTVSIDKKKLFYMQSKGIEKNYAVKIIKQTHLSKVIDLLDDDIKSKIVKII